MSFREVGEQRQNLAIGLGRLGQPAGTMFAWASANRACSSAGSSAGWLVGGIRCCPGGCGLVFADYNCLPPAAGKRGGAERGTVPFCFEDAAI